MTIDEKQLVPMPAEFTKGGIFYKREDDGTFATCCLLAEEFQGERGAWLEVMTNILFKQGRLFVNRNAPWKPVTK